MDKDVYLTKDLYEAAALYSANQKFLGLEREGQFYWFAFENKEVCQKISDDFWAKRVKVDAKSYAEAIRTLKDRIFART